MTTLSLKLSAAALGLALVGGAFAPTQAEAGCGFGCGAAIGAVGGLVAGAAIASQPRPAPVYVAPTYVRPGYTYYEGRPYEDCRRIRWQDDRGVWHRAYECRER